MANDQHYNSVQFLKPGSKVFTVLLERTRSGSRVYLVLAVKGDSIENISTAAGKITGHRTRALPLGGDVVITSGHGYCGAQHIVESLSYVLFGKHTSLELVRM